MAAGLGREPLGALRHGEWLVFLALLRREDAGPLSSPLLALSFYFRENAGIDFLIT